MSVIDWSHHTGTHARGNSTEVDSGVSIFCGLGALLMLVAAIVGSPEIAGMVVGF